VNTYTVFTKEEIDFREAQQEVRQNLPGKWKVLRLTSQEDLSNILENDRRVVLWEQVMQ
jgi:hypothetical protein